MSEANIRRGEKWAKVKKLYEFQERVKDLEWLDSQQAIVDDMKEYEDSIKQKTETAAEKKARLKAEKEAEVQ